MAWTAPRTWNVGEIVTKPIMDTHVRDNLKYLKGQAGVVAIEDGATFAAAVAISGTGGNLLSVTGSATTTGISLVSPNVASQNAQITLTNTSQRAGLIVMDRAADRLKISQNGGATPAIAIEPVNGWVGLNSTASPKGMLHGYDTISGFMKYEIDALAGVAQTIIPDGAGDVLYGMTGFSVVRSSGGGINTGVNSTINGGTVLLLSNNYSIYANGATDVVQIQLAANGSVTVQRTAGTLTYKVSLWLIWL